MAPNLRSTRTDKCNFQPKKDEQMIKAFRALATSSVPTNTKESFPVVHKTMAASQGL